MESVITIAFENPSPLITLCRQRQNITKTSLSKSFATAHGVRGTSLFLGQQNQKHRRYPLHHRRSFQEQQRRPGALPRK